jgi:hypothetical protein
MGFNPAVTDASGNLALRASINTGKEGGYFTGSK